MKPGKLRAAGSNPPKMLRSIHKSFHRISHEALFPQQSTGNGSSGAARNHGRASGLLDLLDQSVAVVALVGDHIAGRRVGQQSGRLADVMLLAGRPSQFDRTRRASMAMGSLVLKPPRERPSDSPSAVPPFLRGAGGMLVGSNDRCAQISSFPDGVLPDL